MVADAESLPSGYDPAAFDSPAPGAGDKPRAVWYTLDLSMQSQLTLDAWLHAGHIQEVNYRLIPSNSVAFVLIHRLCFNRNKCMSDLRGYLWCISCALNMIFQT